MKRIISIMLALLLVMCNAVLAEDKHTYTAQDCDTTQSTGKFEYPERKKYVKIPKVDFTGIRSAYFTADVDLPGGSNGDTVGIVIDDPKSGSVIGNIVLTRIGKNEKYYTEIKSTDGTHDLYLVGTYGKDLSLKIKIVSFTLSCDEYKNDAAAKKVPDSVTVDNYADTWAAVDDMGRKVADFEETGAVKTDTRAVGMLFWNWHTGITTNNRAVVIPEVIEKNPEAKYDYKNMAWDTRGRFYWGEPIYGFYTSFDYWVYKKQAELLSNAGVDAIFFDYSNGGNDYIVTLNALANAFRDAKAKGVRVPKISAMMSLGGDKNDAYIGLSALFCNCFVENDYSDLWFYWEGKPLLYGQVGSNHVLSTIDSDNAYEKALADEMNNFFTIRTNGEKNGEPKQNEWQWLEAFPQPLRNIDKNGRPEFMTVGVAFNQSTIYGASRVGVFSSPYAKDRAYSEVFGEDYSLNGKRMGYFFREQSALALEAAPKFVMIDGWNEWTAIRQIEYEGEKNSFVDLYDDANSRDFEPSRGALKDDYYNLLVDFVRKYKGVRPAPVASGMQSIDISGNTQQWNDVMPQFVNSPMNYERDDDGFGIAGTENVWHYKTTVNNAIKSAKVSFDENSLYFLVTAEENIVTNTDNFMHLYINSDRNHATGWQGYDYAVNLGEVGAISTYNGSWQKIGTAEYSVNANAMQIKIDRNAIAETGTVDFEFKWTDGISGDDVLDFYTEGSSAPVGRFNYLYTEIMQTSLSDSDRAKLSGVSVLSAGKGKMVVNGGKMPVYEADTRITPIEMNGTLYVPEIAINEIMGYGRTKTEYDSTFNAFFLHHFDMNAELDRVVNDLWSYTIVGSLEARVGGELKTLSAPVTAINGIVYVPLTMLYECFGMTVASAGPGAYAVSFGNADAGAVASALATIE